MSNRTKKTDSRLSLQPSLFDTAASEGALDILLGLKQLMSQLITESTKKGKDRYQIAAGVSRLTRKDLTGSILDKLTSSDPAYEVGAVRLAAFCHEVGSLEPFSYLLNPLGAEVVNPEDMKFLRLARLEEQRRKIETEIQLVRTQCGIK